MSPGWQTLMRPELRDDVALDGADVRLLCRTPLSSAIHCSLASGAVSRVTRNVGIHEIWYFIAGRGELWRHTDATGEESLVEIAEGCCVTIPPDTPFQYRNTGSHSLEFACFVAPAWPGPEVNVLLDDVRGRWEPTSFR